MKLITRYSILLFFFIQAVKPLLAQNQDTIGVLPLYPLNYQKPEKYTIGAVQVSGVNYLDPNIVKLFTGLYVGQTISVPGDEITQAIENLWEQKLFTNVQVQILSIAEGKIYLNFVLTENPRLFEFVIRGLKKGKAKSLKEELTLSSGDMVNENLKSKTIREVKAYFYDKGFLNVEVKTSTEVVEGRKNQAILYIDVDRGPRVKVEKIDITGNQGISTKRLKRTFKETKEVWSIRFKRSKFMEENYQTDKMTMLGLYNTKGYRDAQIIRDTVFQISPKRVKIEVEVAEGPKYYFRNIFWTGNTKYTSGFLDTMLGVKRGEIYDVSRLESRLFMSPNGTDVSSLYMDDGYLFFNVVPVETNVENDSIDIEIRMTEGPQAIVNKVSVTGNTKTSDYVILREIRLRPGQKFSRSDIQRSVRELAALGYFDPEKIEVNPKPNYAAGTVDIDFKVEERPSDQVELSGGFGAGFIVGTLGLNLTNFSARKFFKPGEWNPIPSGDGQRLSLRAQSNGTFFQSYNASFSEPWFGGKRPQSFTASIFRSVQTNGIRREQPGRASLTITGATLALGRLVKWPDDYFSISYSLTYQRYDLSNFTSVFAFSDGKSDNVNLRINVGRNSVDQPIYPRSGSQINLSLQITPPISLMNGRNYENATDQEKYRWIEYHKWKFDAAWYTTLVDKLVLSTSARFGMIGMYNRQIGASPFERFYLGGAGLIGFNLDGRELIALRGYRDNSVTPVNELTNNQIGGTIYNKFTAELRYPLSLNPQATIYGLVFTEAGNNFADSKQYNPFNLLRSAGGGVRVFLPMFGLLGIDYGYGFDNNPYRPNSNKGQFHFFIGQQF